MQLGSSIFFAWQSITRHRLRSLLALLGVAAGALALISTVSVEQSWQRTVEEAFRGLNLNAVEVRIAGNVQAAKLKRKDLIDEDAVAIRECCPAVEKLTVYSLDSADIHAGRERAADLQLAYLIDDQYAGVMGLRASTGRLPTADELAQGQRVCLLSPPLERQLFPSGNAIGGPVRVNGVTLRVVGIAAEDRSAAIPVVYLPRALCRAVLHREPETRIQALARDPDGAVRQVETLLRARIGADDRVHYASSPWLARQTALGIRRNAQMIGFLAAFCALLLGGYSVGSLLYTSVVESAREVGIRRALGAGRAAAAVEVMVAGVLFGLVGAAVGIALGRLGAMLAAVPGTTLPANLPQVLSDRMGWASGMPPSLPSHSSVTMPWSAAMAGATFSVLVCGVASLEPALAVAGLSPALAISLGMAPDRRLRTCLAVGQMCVAVAAIALLPSLYEALDRRDRQEARQTFRGDVIWVTAYDTSYTSLHGGEEPPGWTRETDAAFRKALVSPKLLHGLQQAAPLVKSASAVINFQPDSVKAGGRIVWPYQGEMPAGMNVVFVSPSYYPAETAPTAASPGQGTIRYGVFFTEAMAKSGERVCVLDTEATRVIFGDRNDVGKTIRVNGVPFRVVGTMAGGSTTGRWGGREELWSGNILIPIAQYEEVLPALLSGGGRHYEDPMAAGLYVHAADEASVPGAAQQLRRALGRVMPSDLGRKLFLSEPTYGSLREYFALRGSAARRSVLTAALLLLIALVGLTNTLLVSLGERTRELGIRRALGALKSQVLLSLLAEALWLAALGCAAGVIVAWLLSLALRASFASSGALLFSAFWAVAACLTMLIASAFASAIPGVLATRVNPAQALRQE